MNEVINKKKKLLNIILPIAIFAVFLLIDFITKMAISLNMKEGDSITLIPGFLSITYVLNRAAAFGIGTSNPDVNRALYIVIAIIGSGAIIFFFIRNLRKKQDLFIGIVLMLMLVGAIGNLIDRCFFFHVGNFVVDWIDFFKGSPIHDFWHFVFNIADSCIVCGTIALVIYLIVQDVRESRLEKASKPKEIKEDNSKVLSKDEREKLNEKEK